WTERLSGELRAGIKQPIEVFNLLTQGIARAEERLENTRLEFGIDSQQYRAALAGLEFLQSFLERFQKDFATEPLTITVKAEIAPVQGALPDLTLPEQDTNAVRALVDTYRNEVLRVADAQAALTGVTEDTRDAYQEALDVFTIAQGMVEEGSEEWLIL